MISLYPHQQAQIDEVRQAMRHHKAVLVQAPTGSGKSVLAAAMISSAREKKSRAAFVVPRIDLMRQMANTFKEFDINHSYVAAGQPFNQHAYTHICSLGTLINRLDEINPDVVFLDEAHYGAATIDRVIKHFKQRGIWIIGLSATPARQDNFGMGDWYDVMVQGPSIRWLIDNKFLAEYAIVQPSVQMKKGQIGGDPVEEWIKHAGDRLTIAFCRDKAHGQRTADEFTRAGIPAAFMESNTPQDERRRIIEAFADGHVKVVTNVYLCQMGFDLASQIGRKVNVRCLLDLQPTASLTAQMQKNGRALRYDPAGHAIIIDLAGNSYEHNHGYPCADRNWTLDTSDQHKRDVEFRERNISLTTCRHCYMPSKIGPMHCPHCGTMFVVDAKKVRVVDGQLVVITPEMLKRDEQIADMAVKSKRQEVGKAKTMEDLRRIQVARGYAPGWVYQMARVKGIHG